MTKSINRVAAGVVVVFAVTVTGGLSAAVTSADPGSSHSPSDQSRDGGHARDGGQSRGGGDGDGVGRQRGQRGGDRHAGGSSSGSDRPGTPQRGNDRHDNVGNGRGQTGGNGPRGDQNPTGGRGDAPGSDRPGSGSSRGDDVEDDEDKGDDEGDDDGSTGVTAGRGTTGTVTQTPTPSRNTAGGSGTPAAPAVETPAAPAVETPTVPTVATPTVPSVAAASTGGGSAPGSVVAITRPRVVVGDGRAPGLLSARGDDVPAPVSVAPTLPEPSVVVIAAAAPLVAPVPPPPPAPVRQAVAAAESLTMASGHWPLSQTPVASLWGKVQPGWPVGVLFGIAGLLLAPTAGVWLGLRQARATRAAAQLVSP